MGKDVLDKPLNDKELNYYKPPQNVEAQLVGDKVIIENLELGQEFYNKNLFGRILNRKLELSLYEGLYLLDKKRIKVLRKRKELDFKSYLKIAQRLRKKFWTEYCIFSDIRNRGYVVKAALKYGADFRVYPRGAKPGEKHARWVLFCVSEGETFDWRRFAAMNRVAHSVKKRLLIGILDDEGDVTYYEVHWMRP